MSKIFISYRRQDSKPIATLIYMPLAKHFEATFGAGAVFVDVQGIPLGLDFRHYLNKQVQQAELLLALIADRWLTAVDERGRRRLDNPNDFVRIEIEAALKRNIPVVPLYVDGAKFLIEEELPDPLKPLAWRNGFALDTDSRFFEAHLARLIAGLEPHFNGIYRQAAPVDKPLPVAAPPVRAVQPDVTIAMPKRAMLKRPSPRQTIKHEDVADRLIRSFVGHVEAVSSVALSDDGGTALSGSHDKSLRVWDVSSGRTKHVLGGHSKAIYSAALTPDGVFALTGSHDKTLKLWNLSKGQEVKTLSGHTKAVTAVALTPNCRFALSSAGSDFGGERTPELKFWDLLAGRELRSLAGHTLSVDSVALTSNGDYGLSGSDDTTIKLWDLRTGHDLVTLTGHARPVRAIAVTSGGGYAVSGGEDQTLKFWDLKKGQLILTLLGHLDTILSVSLTSDGRYCLSGSADRTLKFWDLEAGSELCTLLGHKASVFSVAMTPDGGYGISGSLDKTIKLWDLSEETQFLR